MNFKINKTAAAVQEQSGGSYISKSGIYDVIIDFASLDVTKNGAESVNFNITYNDNQSTIYGPYVQAGNGDPLEIGLKLINKIFVLADAPEGAPNIEEETHNVGKDNKPQDFAVFTDLSGFACKMRLQEEYSRYDKNDGNGPQISKKLVIKNFYSEDGASAEEVISGTNIGKRLELDSKYADNVTYRDSKKGANDAPTPEDVQAWKDEKAGKTPAAPSKPATKKPSGGLFN